MTILFFIDRFEIGGIVSFLDTLTNYLAKKNVRIIIIGGEDREKKFPFKRYFQSKKIKIYKYLFIRKRRWLEDLTQLISPVITLNQVLNKHKIDLVVLNNPAIAFFLNSKLKKIPKIFHFHGAWDIEENNSFSLENGENGLKKSIKYFKHKIRIKIYYFIESFCLKKVDIICSLSKRSNILLLKHYRLLDRRKIELFPSGVNLSFFRPEKKSLSLKRKILLAKDVPVFFTLCRFNYKKGLDRLLKVASILKKEGYVFKMIVAGPVDSGWFLNKKIFRLYEKLNLQANIHFVHKLGEKEKLKYFQLADAFILPSTGYEAYPYVIMEAMACGLPVIATPVGGIRDMIGELESNLLTRNTNLNSILKKIKWFLNLSTSEKNKIRKECLLYSKKRFDSNKRNERIYNFYQEVISRGKSI